MPMTRKGRSKSNRVHPGRKKSEQDELFLLRQMLGSLDEVIWIRDLQEERLLYVSPAFARVWGRPVESLLISPGTWVDSIHPDDRAKVVSRALINARAGFDRMEYRILRPDGTIRWIQDRSYPIKDSRGEIYRIAGIARDITEG
jgi:PAS domain S-box-containing protein